MFSKVSLLYSYFVSIAINGSHLIPAVITAKIVCTNMDPDTVRARGEPSTDLEKATSTLEIDVIILKLPLVEYYLCSKYQTCTACLHRLENSIPLTENVGNEC